jgi:dipeptide/tripeptide permease
VVSMIAPFIAGTIAQRVGYEALFATALVMALSALFVTLRYIHNPRPKVLVEEAVPAVD